MGKLIKVIVVLTVLWGGWWAIASAGLERSVRAWFDARHAEGWQADVGTIEKAGFPLRLQTRLNDIALADPATGTAVSMDQFDITAAAYWPGYVNVTLPDTPVTLASPSMRATLNAQDAQADLRLRPGTALSLESMVLTSGAWAIDTVASDVLAADTIAVSMTQKKAGAPVYDFRIDAENLTPGTLPRDFLALPADWPLAFETFTGRMTVAFDTVWDRRALDQRRPQPTNIDLQLAQFVWGAVEILATGELAIDADGFASGTISLKAENWAAILNMAETSGYLASGFRPQAEQMLGALAQMSGQTSGLDVTITLQDGRMSLGFIPLGRAPRIILR